MFTTHVLWQASIKEFFAKAKIIFCRKYVPDYSSQRNPSIILFHFLRALIVNVHNDVCVTEAGGILWYKRSLKYEACKYSLSTAKYKFVAEERTHTVIGCCLIAFGLHF